MEGREEILKVFRSFLKVIYEIIKTVAFIALVFFIMRFLIIQPFVVDGNSMEPNFHDKEYLLIEKIAYRFREPKRGDVIIFHPPNHNVYYIKRVIGLPGEKIALDNKVTIYNKDNPSGIALNETYLKPFTNTEGTTILTLGSDEFFVMGDNRENSQDSREFGALPRKNISGRVFITIFPFSDFGLIHHISYSNISMLLSPLGQLLVQK